MTTHGFARGLAEPSPLMVASWDVVLLPEPAPARAPALAPRSRFDRGRRWLKGPHARRLGQWGLLMAKLVVVSGGIATLWVAASMPVQLWRIESDLRLASSRGMMPIWFVPPTGPRELVLSSGTRIELDEDAMMRYTSWLRIKTGRTVALDGGGDIQVPVGESLTVRTFAGEAVLQAGTYHIGSPWMADAMLITVKTGRASARQILRDEWRTYGPSDSVVFIPREGAVSVWASEEELSEVLKSREAVGRKAIAGTRTAQEWMRKLKEINPIQWAELTRQGNDNG